MESLFKGEKKLSKFDEKSLFRNMSGMFLGVVCSLLVLSTPLCLLAQNQLDHITPDFKSISTFKDPKHTPKIEAPDEVVAGEWFAVTITIGEKQLHPSLEDHYVQWIALYKDDIEIARADLTSDIVPQVTFFIVLDESATLRAMEAPTHSASWVASKDILVK